MDPPAPQYSKRPGQALCHELQQQLGSKLMEEEELCYKPPHGALVGDSMDLGRATTCAPHGFEVCPLLFPGRRVRVLHTKHIKK